MAYTALIGRIRRRWYLLIVGAALTAIAAVMIGQVAPTRYDAGAVVLLLPPPMPAERTDNPEAGNPLLRLDGLRTAATALVSAMQDIAVAETIAPAGGTAQYSIQLDALSSAPMVTISASDTTPEGAISVRDAAVRAVPSRLNQVQAEVGVDTPWYITSTVIATDPTAQPNSRQQTRALIVLLVAGAVSTLVLIVVVDSIMVSRRKKLPRGTSRHKGSAATPIVSATTSADHQAQLEHT